ncbi:MAG: ribonuclease III [Betaproteobacteria bacterium]|nr:ribonuclease III [Betaproteobacteria bacterium]
MHELESPDALGHMFTSPALLHQALTHRSHSQPHNERLEFVGDAVLNCAIADALFRRFPNLTEGELSRVRARLVNQSSLAERAGDLRLGSFLLLGEGEVRSGGAARPSILADALEALIGAVFLDAGFDRARAVVLHLFDEVLSSLRADASYKDPKTALQEFLQGRKRPLPEYHVLAVTGEAHRQVFEVECVVPSLGARATGRGGSRRTAEQVAAEGLLRQLAETRSR